MDSLEITNKEIKDNFGSGAEVIGRPERLRELLQAMKSDLESIKIAVDNLESRVDALEGI